MDKLPLNWCECVLEDVCSLENGIKSTDLNLPLLDAKYLRGKKEAEYRNSGVVLNSGNYVILVDGENSGEIFSIKQKGIMGSTFKLLNFTPFCKKEYILYFIHSYQDLFRTNKKGAAIPHLNKEIFRNLELPVPPLAEQGRIVDRIEEIFAKIDAGVEKLKSAQEKIKQYKQSVLHSAFTGKLYKTTEWKSCTLGDIVSKDKYAMKRGPFGSSLKKEYFVENGIRIFEQYNPINEDPYWARYFITKEKFKEMETFKAGAGDLLVSCSGTLGKILLLPDDVEDGIINQALLKIRLDNNKVLNLFFIHWFNSPKTQKLILDSVRGAAIQNIASVKELKQINFPLPTLSEQEKIVEEIEKRFAKADKMLEVVEKSLKFAEQLKQSVLKKAFEGKLVPQDPNDEPASVLLERIKSEKQQNEKVKGKRK